MPDTTDPSADMSKDPRLPNEDTSAGSEPGEGFTTRAWRLVTVLLKGVVSISSFGAVMTSFILVGRSIFDDSILIQPISVPKAINESGYTPEVVASRLRDAISTCVKSARTRMKTHEISIDQNDSSDVAIPNVGLSTLTLATDVSRFFGIKSRQIISGEVILADKVPSLRLRLDGKAFTSISGQPDEADLDILLTSAARSVLERTQPFLLASCEFKKNREHALALLNGMIATLPPRDPQLKYAYNLKGFIFRDMNRRAEAMAEYRRALDIDPNFVVALSNVGRLFLDEKQYAKAEQMFRRAIKSDDTFSFAHAGLGAVLSEQGKPDEAVAQFALAVRLGPKTAFPYTSLGNFLSKAGRPDAAEAEYRKAIAVDPEAAAPRVGLANLLRDRGRLNEAADEYRKAIDIDPLGAFAHVSFGILLRKQGLLDEAAAEYRKAIEITPDSAAPHTRLGDLWESRGDLDAAAAEYRKAIELDPAAAEPRRRLETLSKKMKPPAGVEPTVPF